MNKQYQNGSIHLVIVSLLTIIILSAVGFLFWQNYINKDSNSKPGASENTHTGRAGSKFPQVATTKKYQNSRFSFEYPVSGWQVNEIKYGVDEEEPTVVVRTSNYAQTGVGLDAGAEVAINIFRKDDTLASMKQGVMEFAGGTQYKDLADTKVSGVDAFSYNSMYEGPRYHTVFLYKGYGYDIIYQYPIDEKPETYMKGYNTIVSSLWLK